MAYASCAFDVSADRVGTSGPYARGDAPDAVSRKRRFGPRHSRGLGGPHERRRSGGREPDRPYAHLAWDGWRESSRRADRRSRAVGRAGRSDEAITLVRQAMRESFGYPAHTILALEDLPSLCLLPFVYQVRNDIVDERFVFGSDPCTREIDESYFSFNALRLVFLKHHGEALGPGHASEVNHREIERVDPEYPSLVFLTRVRTRVNNRPDATSRGIMGGDPKLQVTGQRASPSSPW